MVCTNGLTDVLSDEQLGLALQRRVTPDEQCQDLLDAALAAGARDDVTVLVARYRIPAGD